ncbi:MAG: hypothetical protein ACYS22_02030 [Planctomycetota bacterium]|jgi:hypothetical protein
MPASPASPGARSAHARTAERGYALIMAAFLGILFAGLGFAAVVSATVESRSTISLNNRVTANLAASSGVNYAIARVRRGGITNESFSLVVGDAAVTVDVTTAGKLVTIVSQADIAARPEPISVWARAVLFKSRYVPNAPMYFGNGAIEWPRGNFEGHSVTSWISNALNLHVSAWNHPLDYINNPIPTPPFGDPRWSNQDPSSPGFGQPFSVFESQNSFGGQNVASWLAPWTSGGTLYDPLTRVEHVPDAGYDPFPTDSSAPDVQTFAYDLIASSADRGTDLFLSPSDVQNGNYTNDTSSTDAINGLGTVDDPRVVFVTGKFLNSNKAFKGSGILVIRDDYDPAVGGFRNVSNRSTMDIRKTLEWTGLVVVAGWAPDIKTQSLPTSEHVLINGSLMGEDSVQSGGETSLENATIILRIGAGYGSGTQRGDFQVTYSREVFSETLPNGSPNPIYNLLPVVQKGLSSLKTAEGARPAWAP